MSLGNTFCSFPSKFMEITFDKKFYLSIFYSNQKGKRMNLNFSEEDQKFKTEVRSFIQENLNKETAKRVEEGLSISKESTQEWQKKLASKGWLAPGWPKEYGGTGWSLTQRYIFDEECGVASTPRTIPFGVTMVGPVIIKYGTEEQ